MIAVDDALTELARLCESGAVPTADAFCRSHGGGVELRSAVEDFLFVWEGLRVNLTARMAPPPERLGEFRILREIGRGGMGIVYEAEQTSLGRTVALKVLPAHATLRGSSVERFRREASMAARLRHPGIVEVHAVGESEGTHYFAMELVEGCSLAERLDSLRSTSLLPRSGAELVPTSRERTYAAAVARMGLELADALDYAHRHGVVHRDVKPSNVLLRRDGHAVLTDFGLAREESRAGLTRTGHFGGTPQYVAPEQASGGRPVDGRADLFSLGVTLYEALALRRPFEGETSHGIIRKILTEEPARLTGSDGRVPRDLETAIFKCLEKDPDARYASAAEFAADLRAFLEGRPLAARPVSSLTRVARWTRREPAKAAAASLAAVLVLGVVFGAGWVVPRLTEASARERRDLSEQQAANGFLALADRDYGRALGWFDDALGADLASIEAVMGRTMALTHGPRPKDALDFVDGAIGRIGARRELRRIRALALSALGREAEAAATAAELGPPESDVECFVEAAALLRRAGESDVEALRHAAELLDRAILASPRARAVYYCDLAFAAFHGKDPATARRVALALEQLWPASSAALRRAALAWSSIDPKRSIELYKRAVELAPADPAASSELAAALLLTAKDPEAAIEAARKALALDPAYANGRVVLASALNASGRPEEAERELREALALDPRHWQAHLNLARLLQSKKDASALEEFRAAAECAPREVKALVQYGWALRAAGRQAEALEFLSRASELDPGNFEVLQMRATVHRELGEFDRAVELLDRARELAPDKPFVVRDLGSALLGAGRAEEALTAFRRYLELHPAATDAHLKIGYALEALGDRDGALGALRTAAERVPPAARAEVEAAIGRVEASRGAADVK